MADRPASQILILALLLLTRTGTGTGTAIEATATAGLVPPATADDPAPRASRSIRPPTPRTADDPTFRPTVRVRRGASVGSGTVIASRPGEALVLTAAHVAAAEPGGDRPMVEVHRYNLGLERSRPPTGWPRSFPAEVVAADRASDVALLRARGLPLLPFVARLGPLDEPPAPGTTATSIGLDRGEDLKSWETRVRGVVRLNRTGLDEQPRPFVVTERAPEHGRSGGGLFREDGRLIGVCVGRIELAGGGAIGLFAAPESVRAVLAAEASAMALKAFAGSSPNRGALQPPAGRRE